MFRYLLRSNRWMVVVLSSIALLTVLTTVHAAPLVKKSSSGLCHSEESPYYDRTKTFTGYASREECTKSGGQLRDGVMLARHSELDPEYERSKFGHGWADTDGDCQNSRMEALISKSTRPVQFADGDRCRVTRGRWISPFTGNVITDASKIDIDHAVPLKFAWEHGADDWSQEKRERFANDSINLLSVEASLNRSKGARGLGDWLPPLGQCQYIARFIRVTKIYRLTFADDEVENYETMRQRCYTQYQ